MQTFLLLLLLLHNFIHSLILAALYLSLQQGPSWSFNVFVIIIFNSKLTTSPFRRIRVMKLLKPMKHSVLNIK